MLTFLSIFACTKAQTMDSGLTAIDCNDADYSLVPPAAGELSGAWDADRDRFVFYGGNMGIPENCSFSATDFTGEAWAWNADCGDFERIGDAPSARGRYASAVDPDTGRWILHGGRMREGDSGNYTLFSEVWSFEFATGAWTLLSSEGGPGKRTSHVGVVSGGKFIVYGGNSSRNGASYTVHDDVWSFDLATNTWTELETTGNVGNRLFAGADLSPDGNTLYVYGGGDENAFFGPFLGDMWALDLTTLAWDKLHNGRNDAPVDRIGPELLMDADRNRLLMFGGHDSGELGNTNQLWAFDLGSNTWSEIHVGDVFANAASGQCDFPSDFTTPDFDSPERRYQFAFSATDDGRAVMFGGKTDCGVVNDIWTLDLASGAWSEESTATEGEICLRAFAECESLCI